MRFFIDPTPFTHRARFYGFPAYFKSNGSDGCELAGTNVIWDWCILHIAPLLHTVIDMLHHWSDPCYESEGWQIELLGELPKP
jgi:hypothetical protein